MITCYRRIDKGILLNLRVTPNAGKDTIDRPEMRDDGTATLRIRVVAAPDKGKANKAVTDLLAKTFGIPKSSISVKSGETARLKTPVISGDPESLIKTIADL